MRCTVIRIARLKKSTFTLTCLNRRTSSSGCYECILLTAVKSCIIKTEAIRLSFAQFLTLFVPLSFSLATFQFVEDYADLLMISTYLLLIS